jgi:hypothetical protein
MKRVSATFRLSRGRRVALAACALTSLIWSVANVPVAALDAPVPLLGKGKTVDWWFIYKFNGHDFSGCGADSGVRACPFGGKVRTKDGANYSQQFVFASKDAGKLVQGKGCVGTTLTDPLGATFDQLYNGSPYFVIWNDQFYGDPKLKACGSSGNCDSPWGHSKGMLAWNDAGEGLVLQVSTPSWPAAGSAKHPRKAGNTLGCVSTQNNLSNAQHFFALKLSKTDLIAVLEGLQNSSVVTDPTNGQIARLGGPSDVRDLAEKLGQKSASKKFIKTQLSSGVLLISKPSGLNVPPWQMVSALLDSTSERTATWWASPQIYSTGKTTKIGCWDDAVLTKKPGAIDIAKTGTWDGKSIGLIGGQNHAKIGVTTSGDKHYAIFGDLNQQGTINPPKCDRSQNGRGGMFFVVENKELFDTVSGLLEGDSAPVKAK